MSWTIIGIYETGEVFAQWSAQADAHQAIREVALASRNLEQIVCAVPTDVTKGIVAPCEDANKAAFVSDLMDAIEDEGKEREECPRHTQPYGFLLSPNVPCTCKGASL
jgi:hypothetical protein